MKKNWILFLFTTLLSCIPLKKEPVVETDLLVSISASQLNFIDFPISIASVELIDEEGVEQRLTGAVKLNLANLGEHYHIVGRYKGMPTGNYVKLKIYLKFNKDSDIVFYSKNTDTKYTKKLLSPRGKELGTEQGEYTLEVPLMTKNTHVEINKSATHLNLEFNLDNMIAIREGKDDVLLELRPLLSVREINQEGEFRIRGEVTGLSKNKLTIKTRFIGSVDIDASQVKWVKLDNKKLKSAISSKVVNQRVVADITLNEKNELIANTVNLYSENIKLFKGLVTKKSGASITLLGNDYSSASYLNNKNVYLTIPENIFPIPVGKVTIKSPVSIDISSLDLKKKEDKSNVLKGPENYVVSSGKNNTSKDKLTLVENDLEQLYFYYSKKTENEIKKIETDYKNSSGLELNFVGPLTLNGAYIGNNDWYLMDLSNFNENLEEGFYRADGYIRYNGVQDHLYFFPETLSKVSTNQKGRYYFFDVTDFNAWLMESDGNLELTMGLLDLDKMTVGDSKKITWPELRIGANGNKLSLVDRKIAFYDNDNEKWDTPCNSLTFEFVEKEDGSPNVILQYEKGGADDDLTEVFHFAKSDELMSWFGNISNTVYMDIMDITGDLTSKKGEEACKFKADFLFIMVIDDKVSRQRISYIADEINARRAGGSTLINGILIGIGIAAIAGVVAMIVDTVKKKRTAKKLASANMSEGGSSRMNNRALPGIPSKYADLDVSKAIVLDGDSSEINKVYSSESQNILYESIDTDTDTEQDADLDSKKKTVTLEKFNKNTLTSSDKISPYSDKNIKVLDIVTDPINVKPKPNIIKRRRK